MSGQQDEACPPPPPASGTPAPVQGTAVPGVIPPLATVVHTSYAPAPATGIPVDGMPARHADGNPFYPNAPTAAQAAAGGAGGQGQPQLFYPPFPGGRGGPGGPGGQPHPAHLAQLQQFMTTDPNTGQAVVQIPEGSGLVEHVVARQLSRSLKLFAFIDILLCLLYVFAGYLFTAFAVVGPICGYYGAKNYQRHHTLCYVIFCFLNTCWRLAVFIMAESLTAQVLGFLMVFIEIYITRLVIRFYKLLRGFSDDDLNLLRALDHMPVQMVYW